MNHDKNMTDFIGNSIIQGGKRMRKFLVRALSVTLAMMITLCSSVVMAGAISYPNEVKTKSKSILMVNMDSWQTVFEQEADTRRYPASTTKIMTFIVAYENIVDIDNTKVEIKESIIEQLNNTGSSMANLGAHVGEKMSVKDLLYSMMVPSGNDAALMLADYVGGGNVEKFVKMMNDKAEELGCKDTHFANPDGLHDDNHYTTARDMYIITKYALTLPDFDTISSATEYTCAGDDVTLVTTNYLIDRNRGGEYYYMYAKGIKTGTTDEAGRCLVTTATADGYSYLLVLLGAPYKEGEYEEYDTFTDAADLFRWALTSLELQTIKTSKTPVIEQKVKLAWGKDSVMLVPEKDLNAVVPKDINTENIVVETDLDNSEEPLEAPLSPDQPVGKATVYYRVSADAEKQKIATVNLVPSEQIDRSGILVVLDVMGTIFQSYWFLIVIGLMILILIIYVIAAKIHRRRVAKRRKVKRYRNF